MKNFLCFLCWRFYRRVQNFPMRIYCPLLVFDVSLYEELEIVVNFKTSPSIETKFRYKRYHFFVQVVFSVSEVGIQAQNFLDLTLSPE